MVNYILGFVLMLVLGLPSFAQMRPESRFGYDARFQLYGRHIKRTGKAEVETVQSISRADGFLSISPSGCLRLAGRVSSGQTYNSEWEDTGLGDGDREFHANLRHLYVDSKCYSRRIQAQLGALPVEAAGSLGLSSSGWVDGVRIIYAEDQNKRRWVFTAGEVDELRTPQFFERQLNGINHLQLRISQGIGKNSTLTADLNHHVSRFYNRLIIEHVLKDYVSFIEKVSVEEFVIDDRHLGALARLTLKIPSWEVQIAATNIKAGVDPLIRQDQLIKPFYGFGNNGSIEIQRALPRNYATFFRLRNGEAGAWVELGLAKRFRRPN